MNQISEFYAIDIFAGCGGLSEGFKQAGFQVISQVEMDKWATETLRTRHLYYELGKHTDRCSLYNQYLREEVSRDSIIESHPSLKEMILYRVTQATFGEDELTSIYKKIEASRTFHGAPRFHVLLGGPPCQPYSVIGRSRDPARMENDKRHYLYKFYLQMLEYLQPDIFVYENVPGVFTARSGGKEAFLRISEDLLSLRPSYKTSPPLEKISEDPREYTLKSETFRIPQHRERLFLIGYRESLECKNPSFRNMFEILQKQAMENSLTESLTVYDAISDLPSLYPGRGKDGWFGPYSESEDITTYQIKMRKNSPGIINHRARTHMKSDIERYRFFIEHSRNGNRRSDLRDLMEKRPDLIPNHKHLDKFLDRFKVQCWDYPSSTITAHISKDGHYYIHPDINQYRSFTAREAARCQSFPDNFKFEGPRTEQFKQVGNAVPPILAHSIACVIKRELEKVYAN